MELWKEIIGFDGYKVSNRGRIRGNSGRIINMRIEKDGYVDVSLWKNRRKVRARVHRLVAIAFLPNPENKPQINHKNGIRTDNRLSNLEWCTHLENSAGFVFDETFKGENNMSAVLTDKKVLEIREKYKSGNISMAKLAQEYNVGETTIGRVINRASWQHI